MVTLLSLPLELHYQITTYLPTACLAHLTATCRCLFNLHHTPFQPRLLQSHHLPAVLRHYITGRHTRALTSLLTALTPTTPLPPTLSGDYNPLWPPLTLAAYTGHTPTLTLLLPHTPWPTDPELCPLRMTAREGNLAAAIVLIDWLQTTHGDLTPDWSGFEPAFRTAAKHCGPKNIVLEEFLRRGVSAELLDVGIEAAVRADSDWGVRALVRRGAECKDVWVAAAARRGRWGLVRVLVCEGGCMVDCVGVRVAGTALLEAAMKVVAGWRAWPGWEEVDWSGVEWEEEGGLVEEARRWVREGWELCRLLREYGADVALAECLLENYGLGREEKEEVRRVMRECVQEEEDEEEGVEEYVPRE